MVLMQGLQLFKEKFQRFTDHYIIIGGVACAIIFDEVGQAFRTTRDIDIVVIMEHNGHDFANAFWEFIRDGQYAGIASGTTFKNFYRFEHPQTAGYPHMIELFSRRPTAFEIRTDTRYTPLPIDDEVSSLSAILLDEAYYAFMQARKKIVDDLSILDESGLIPFKVKAYLDMHERIERGDSAGQGLTSKREKHKKDVIRLTRLLTPEQRVELPESIRQDLQRFIDLLDAENIDFTQFGWGDGGRNARSRTAARAAFFTQLSNCYGLTSVLE